MSEPRTTGRDGKRFYTWRDENYWSVTTIIGGGLPKPALLPWGIKSVAEGAVEALEAGDGLVDMVRQDRDNAIRWLKGLPYAKRDRAADLGTEIHQAVEAYVLGKPMPAWTPIAKPRMLQFERFLAAYKPDYEDGCAEAPVLNRTERYAGTMDAIATIGGVRYIIDTKSGKGVYPEVGLQLAAYRYAEFIGLPDGDERAMPTVDKAAVLHLADGEFHLIEVVADEQMFRTFLYVREVFRFTQDTAKSVLLGDVPAVEEVAA